MSVLPGSIVAIGVKAGIVVVEALAAAALAGATLSPWSALRVAATARARDAGAAAPNSGPARDAAAIAAPARPVAGPAAALERAAPSLSAALADGVLTPLPITAFGLADAVAAHEAVESGTPGKVVLDLRAG